MDTIKSPYLDDTALEMEGLGEELRTMTKSSRSPFMTHEFLVEDELNKMEPFNDAWSDEEFEFSSENDAFEEEIEFDNETFFEGEGYADEYQQEFEEDFEDDFPSNYLNHKNGTEKEESGSDPIQEEQNNIIYLAQEISKEAFSNSSFPEMEVGFDKEDDFDSGMELEELIDVQTEEEAYLYDDIQSFTLEEAQTTNATKGEGLSSIAKQSEKQWNASKNRPRKWIGKVYGLVVHTTGGGLPGRAIKNGRYPTNEAVNWYTRGRRKKSFHGGCHYVNGWQGLMGGDLLQIANERERAHGVGTPEQRKSIKNNRFEKDLPAKVIEHWKKRWPGHTNSLRLLPGGQHPNSCCIHVECTPVFYYLNNRGVVSEKYPPMRPGLRFTKAQHDTIAYLACDIAIRNGWPLNEQWWRTPRLLGHEDLTPITRLDKIGTWDKRGAWDPGFLRDKPYFDWNYVYDKIKEIKNNGYKLPGRNPINNSGGFIGNVLNKGKDIVGSIFNKGKLISVALASISKGEKDENKITNAVFYAKHPDRLGQKLKRNDPLAKDWISIRKNIVRPLFKKKMK